MGTRLRPNRTAVEEALTRDQIPVPEEFSTPQGGSTPQDDDAEPWADEEEEEAADVAPPPLFSQSARMSPRISQGARAVAKVVMPLTLGGAAGSAASAALGFATMNPLAIGAGMGVGSTFVRSRTNPHTTPMADARASMRSRVESAEPTSQMEQDEQEVYVEAFEQRVNPPHNDTDEEAHRFAWAAVLRFREDARQSQESFASTRQSGPDILGVRPGTGGASRADRVV